MPLAARSVWICQIRQTQVGFLEVTDSTIRPRGGQTSSLVGEMDSGSRKVIFRKRVPILAQPHSIGIFMLVAIHPTAPIRRDAAVWPIRHFLQPAKYNS